MNFFEEIKATVTNTTAMREHINQLREHWKTQLSDLITNYSNKLT